MEGPVWLDGCQLVVLVLFIGWGLDIEVVSRGGVCIAVPSGMRFGGETDTGDGWRVGRCWGDVEDRRRSGCRC
jgi:hypothetical protein